MHAYITTCITLTGWLSLAVAVSGCLICCLGTWHTWRHTTPGRWGTTWWWGPTLFWSLWWDMLIKITWSQYIHEGPDSSVPGGHGVPGEEAGQPDAGGGEGGGQGGDGWYKREDWYKNCEWILDRFSWVRNIGRQYLFSTKFWPSIFQTFILLHTKFGMLIVSESTTILVWKCVTTLRTPDILKTKIQKIIVKFEKHVFLGFW